MFSVLYVDDEPTLLELGKIFLELSDRLRIDIALSAAEAIEKLDTKAYDGIISDYQMPEMDGITFLNHIRRNLGQLPFILFTGKGREEVVIEALNSGADFYLQKGGEPRSQFAELEHKIISAIIRRKTETALSESQQRMADIIDFLPDATFAIDRQGRVIAWNRAIVEMTGVKKEDILGKPNSESGISIYGRRRPLLIDLVLTDNKEVEKEYPFVKRKDNSLISEMFIPTLYGGKGAFVWFIASPLFNADGTVIGAIESIRDITERKIIEDALAASEERYRNVVEDQTEFICRFLPDQTVVFVNEAYCRYFSLTREGIIGRKFTPDIPEKDRKLIRNHFASLTRAHPADVIEHQIIMPGGAIRWQRWSDRAIFDNEGRIIEYQSVGYDITNRKLAEEELRSSHEQLAAAEEELRQQYDELRNGEEALRESEKIYRTLFENTGTATVLLDDDTMILLANAEFEQLSGYTRKELENRKSWTEFVVKEDLERMMEQHRTRRKNGEAALKHYEFRFIKRTGETRIIFLTVDIIPGTKRSVASLLDITDRKQAEEELRSSHEQLAAAEEELRQQYDELRNGEKALMESEKIYRTLFENTGSATVLLDDNTRILLANAEFEQLSGYTRKELENRKSWTEFVVKEDLEHMMEQHRMRRKKGEAALKNYEFGFVRRNGDIRKIFLTIDVIPGTKNSVASLTDITALKKR